MTSNQLASLLNVSSKTIKRDIKDLNLIYPNIVLSDDKGYRINKDLALTVSNLNKQVPETYEDRKTIILKQLLTNNEIDISSLSDELYISSATLLNELTKLRSELDKYNLNLHIKKDVISISGSNKGKQKLLIELFNDELKDSFFSLDKIQQFFMVVNLKELKNTILSELNKNEYFLDDYSLTNYVFHVALLVENGIKHSYQSKYDDKCVFNEDLNTLCVNLYECLKEKYPNKFSFSDFLDASFLMLTRIARRDYIPDKDISLLINENVRNLVTSIIKSVKLNFAVDLDTEDFVIPFTFHVKNLLIRLENESQMVNLQFDQIKSQFPLLYSISVFIAEKIEKYANHKINEDEIAFIAMHVGVVIEKKSIEENKLKCIVVAPNYYALGDKIAKSLSKKFDDDLFIKDIYVSNVNSIDSDIDLCITTFGSSLKQINNVLTINVNPFLTDEDFNKISNSINFLKDKKKKAIVSKKLMYFINEELFFVNPKYKNRDEVINVLSKLLEKEGYVDEKFKDKLFQREEISSSAFDNIAIPHPLAYDSKKSVLAIIISKDGILWDKNKVNFIFMFALNADDHSKFADVFDSITYLFKDTHNEEKLLSIKSFDDFIDFITNN